MLLPWKDPTHFEGNVIFLVVLVWFLFVLFCFNKLFIRPTQKSYSSAISVFEGPKKLLLVSTLYL